jgi:hypothetical protein
VVDPENPGRVKKIGIQQRVIATLRKEIDRKRLARLQLVVEVSASPYAIIRGWDRTNKDDCYVYVGKPTRDYTSIADHAVGSIDVPAPKNHFFVVFVLPDGTISDWTWRLADPVQPDRPKDINGDIVWTPE